MLPESGGIELLAVAALALIIVGPKDLPVLLRKVGKFVGKMRAMAQEFRASFDELARQSELDELRKEVEAMRLAQTYDPTGLVPGAYGAQSGYDASIGLEPNVPPMNPVIEEAAPTKAKPAKRARATKAATAKAPAKTTTAKTPAAKDAAKTKPAAKAKAPAAAKSATTKARKAATSKPRAGTVR